LRKQVFLKLTLNPLFDQLMKRSKYFIKNMLRPKLKPYWSSNQSKFAAFSDDEYFLPSISQVKSMTGKYLQDLKPSTSLDCDDYSFIAKGMAAKYMRDVIQEDTSMCFGIVWAEFGWVSGFHAANWFVSDDLHFYWFEPQTNEVKPFSEISKNLRLLIA